MISDGRMFHKGIAGKRKIYTHSYEKKLDEIYTDEIHVVAKCTRLNMLLHWDCCQTM